LKKDLKEQIKRDELVSGIERAAIWASTHRGELRLGLGVAAVLGVAAAAIFYYQANRAREAERAFRAAVVIYEAPVTAEQLGTGAEKPAGLAYATADEKYKAAAAAFDGVERRYGSLGLAERARYYAALSRVELKQYAEAEKALKAVAQRKDGVALEPTLARLALADLMRRQGQVDQAVEEYRAIVGDPALPLPRDFALMSLAATLEDARRHEEAALAYKQLTEEFPASVYAAEARRKAGYLQGPKRS
jgi:hypothetical protein